MSYSRRESKQQRKSTSIFDLLGQEVMESMLAFAQQSTEQRQIGSKVFDEEREAAIPRFDMSGNIFFYLHVYRCQPFPGRVVVAKSITPLPYQLPRSYRLFMHLLNNSEQRFARVLSWEEVDSVMSVKFWQSLYWN